jgi:hypothetical protein
VAVSGTGRFDARVLAGTIFVIEPALLPERVALLDVAGPDVAADGDPEATLPEPAAVVDGCGEPELLAPPPPDVHATAVNRMVAAAIAEGSRRNGRAAPRDDKRARSAHFKMIPPRINPPIERGHHEGSTRHEDHTSGPRR